MSTEKVKAALAAMRARCEAAGSCGRSAAASQADVPKLLAVAEAAAALAAADDAYHVDLEDNTDAPYTERFRALESAWIAASAQFRAALAALEEP